MSRGLGERYRLGEQIAAGGMGSVYRAVDELLGRQVAVKVLRRELAEDPTFLERFRREARSAACLSHMGVAGVYDYGELGGQPFIVMELVDGETLAERVAARGPLPWPEALAVGEQVARALAAAHANGLVHRDVKPANILLGVDGRAKVTDFGIAQAAQTTTLTRSGMVLGSANYVAPEQAQGGHVGPAADLYSLGCVLFEAVTGETPYRGANPVAIATQHVSAPVPDPRELVPDLPRQVAALIIRALDKDPGRRFASASAMADALAATHAGGEAAAPAGQMPALAAEPAPTPTPPVPWVAVSPDRATRPQRPVGLPRKGPGGRRGQPNRRAPAGGGRGTPRGSHGRSRRLLPPRTIGAALVLVALLLAWLPRSGLLDPPAGQAEGPRPGAGSATAGEATVQVPDVVGQQAAAAEARLRELGLATRTTGAGRNGRVREVDPRPGTAVAAGSTVELVIDAKSKKGRKGKGGDGDDRDGDH
jgi:eukaryotic-like serine/threonine-protein kinase